MRKEAYVRFVLLLIILTSSIVIAQDTPIEIIENTNAQGESVQDTVKELREDVPTTSGIRDRSNEILAKQIQIPENLQILTRIVLGLKQGTTVNLQLFVIFIALWFILLLLVKSIFDIVPMIGGGGKSWLLGILVTILISFAGGINLAVKIILEISSLFGILENWGIIQLIIAILLLILFYFVLSRIFKVIKKQEEKTEADKIGENIGFASAIGQAIRRTIGK